MRQGTTGTLAVTAQAPSQAWGRWPAQNSQQSVDTFYNMNISGIVQPFDPRISSSATVSRGIVAHHYMPVNVYNHSNPDALIPPSHSQQHLNQHHQHQSQPIQQSPFHFPGYIPAVANTSLPGAYASNYIQQRPLPRLMQPEEHVDREHYHRGQCRGFVNDHQSQSPTIKAESPWNLQSSSTLTTPSGKNITPNSGQAANFGTEVDTLMKAIQAKATPAQSLSNSPTIQDRVSITEMPSRSTYITHAHTLPGLGDNSTSKSHQEKTQESFPSSKPTKKRYQCTISGCSKTFFQKTHLDIHERAHTGDKPYVRKITSSFSSELTVVASHARHRVVAEASLN